MAEVVIFLLGLGVGSFLNVLIDRLPREESVVKGRSYCESCRKTLEWYDLIPVFSFMLLGGKCRYCHSPISWYYPAVELLTGIVFVSVFIFLPKQIFNFQFSIFNYVYYIILTSALIVIFFSDIKYGIIPDKIVYPTIAISLPYLFLIHPSADGLFMIHLLSAIGAFLLFLLLHLATRGRGMGFGDVKLAFLMGFFLGFPKIIVSLYAAFLTGAVVSMILILYKKKKFKGDTIPFGPFLVVGSFIALFWGKMIVEKALPILLIGS